MVDPIIVCPHCKKEIKLTESLAAPLLKEAEVAFNQKLHLARSELIKEAEEKAAIKSKSTVDELTARLNNQSNQIEEARQTETRALVKERELEDARRDLELTLQKRLSSEIDQVRRKAVETTQAENSLRLAEKGNLISSLQTQIEALRQKAEQGSQQLQGEVQELQLEEELTKAFPLDKIIPVPKGEHGGDVLQKVISSSGASAGTILWESKRTKNWSGGWLDKLKTDQRAAKADLSVITTQALPEEIKTFGFLDGVWITAFEFSIPLAASLRYAILEISLARRSVGGQQTKAESIYQYITGPQFRQRIQVLGEAFSSMKDDLDKERKLITKQWAKRETQISRALGSTTGMYGDLQGIAEKALPELESVTLQLEDQNG